MGMSALYLVQEAATRVGIVQPSTIENVSSTDPSKKDPDAMILLGALNETMRQAIVKNLFDPFCVITKIVLTSADAVPNAGNTFIFPLLTKIQDYGGLLTSYFNVEYGSAAPASKSGDNAVTTIETFFECDPDMFLKYWKEPTATAPEPIPTKNMYRIYNGSIYFIARAAFSATSLFNNIRFTYRSTYGVLPSGSTTPVSSFTRDADVSNVDDELLICGTVLNYKAYQGLDYQFDVQKFNDYLGALERNRQRSNLFKDASMVRPDAQG